MKFHRQLIQHTPDSGLTGDCHRTAIACILDLEPESVPHFFKDGLRPEVDWRADVEAYLNSIGYTQADVMFGAPLPELFQYMQDRNPSTLYLMGGVSLRDTPHTVVCLGGTFFHDPHPGDVFLSRPFDHGYWEITFILPLSMKVGQFVGGEHA